MSVVIEQPVPVRWRDTDALGHVNHSVFLSYLEEGRDTFYLEVLASEPSYVIVRLEIDFRAEVRYEDRQVLVRIEVERVGRTSLTTKETVLNSAGEVAATARVVSVLWDGTLRKAIPFGAEARAKLAPDVGAGR